MLSNMFAIKTWTCVTLFACMVYGQRKPPNYQQNEMPPTSFSCNDKIVGGYYADPETSCQMFHVCVNVVGSGLQDFRFLCPNDTAFDQENQICDDWYNIDCEAATLYYSDNFDLYKLGSGGAQAVTSGKVTPIPLGPSSAAPIVQPRAKPRKPQPPLSAPVNNAVSENDDDYYLQRSDSSDSKLQHDLLRGSSSGNFFSNRNRGVENPDDYDDTRVSSSKDVPKKNTKAPFRKLLTGKKPIAESSTGAPSTTETLQWTTGSTTTTTVRQPNYKPTTYRSKDRGRVNYKTYLDKQAKADEYDFQKVAKPATATQSATTVSSSFQTTTVRANSNNVYQTTQINIAPANQPKNNDFLRIAPVNNNNNNGFHSARINAVPSNNNNNNFPANNNNNFPANNNNNFQANNNNNFPANNNNNFQANSNNNFPANNNNNFQANSNNFQANNNNFQANNNNFRVNNGFPSNFESNKVFQPVNNANAQNTQQNNINYNQAFVSDKIASTTVQNFKNQSPTTNGYQTNSFQQQGNNAFQQGNTFQTGNAFQPANNFQQSGNAAFQPDNQFQNVAPTTQNYNGYQSSTAYQQTTNSFQSPTVYNAGNSFQQQQQQQQTSPQPQFQSTTEHFSKDYKAKFDPYNSYHQRTNEEAGETLKTASSTNLRPSDLNALIQPKPKSINATLSVGFSFNKVDGGVAKSTVIVPAPTTQKPRPFTTQPTTVQQSTQTVARTTAFAAVPSTTKKAVVTKDKDSSYDYAYYDDSNHNDYSDVVPEEFSRIQNAKKL